MYDNVHDIHDYQRWLESSEPIVIIFKPCETSHVTTLSPALYVYKL